MPLAQSIYLDYIWSKYLLVTAIGISELLNRVKMPKSYGQEVPIAVIVRYFECERCRFVNYTLCFYKLKIMLDVTDNQVLQSSWHQNCTKRNTMN